MGFTVSFPLEFGEGGTEGGRGSVGGGGGGVSHE